MSTLVENVQKVVDAHAGLSAAISAKGVAVPEGTKLSEMPALVSQIETPPVPTNQRAIFSYDMSNKTIVVPKMIVVDMVAMTNLNNCFSNCVSLTSLTLPDGFGQNATDTGGCFYNCTSLTSLTLPVGFGQNTKTLFACFNNCRQITSLSLPDGFGQTATNIRGCFSGCSNLVSLSLPTRFGLAAMDLYQCFTNCSSLTNIIGNPNFRVSLSLADSTNLTHDSLMVVINGLQTITTSQVLTLGTTNLAKLTYEEKAIATSKGWTLA